MNGFVSCEPVLLPRVGDVQGESPSLSPLSPPPGPGRVPQPLQG